MAIKVFISKDKKQFKANMHCHSTISDGRLTPEELKEAYKAQGYSVLAITDHCYPYPHNDMTDDDFLMLTGYEAYIRPNKKAKSDRYLPEVHLNLFARDKDNDKYICYNPVYCKYYKGDPEKLNRVGSEEPREYTMDYLNMFIKTATENGYVVSYNHPVWSMESDENIFKLEGWQSLELDNTDANHINTLEHNEVLYDKLLRRGIRVGCHGGDDNHNRYPFGHPLCDSFGAHTMIVADKLEYDSVFSAFERGDCYSSTGPRILSLSIEDGNIVRVETTDAERIIMFYGTKKANIEIDENYGTVNSAEFELHHKANYFRITVIDKQGRKACSRGYFRDEF